MADGGEGEDEIQFLRTVSAAARVLPGEGAPGGRPGRVTAGPRGRAEGPSGMRGGQHHQVCAGVRVGPGRAGRVSVRACGKPGDPVRPERGEPAEGAGARSRGTGDPSYPASGTPISWVGPPRRLGQGQPVGLGGYGDSGSRREYRHRAVPGALGLAPRAVTERGPGEPWTWQRAHVGDWPGSGTRDAAQTFPPSQGAAKGVEGLPPGLRGSPGWCHGGAVTACRARCMGSGVCVCVCTRVSVCGEG
jgi:hypothetical protein